MDGDGGEMEFARFVEYLIEPIRGLGGIIQRAAQFNREWKSTDRVADFSHDRDGRRWVRQQIAAPAATEDFADGAREIEIDDVETRFDKNL